MRRIVLSLAAAGAFALTACSGGGSVLGFNSNSNPDRVVVTTVGASNIARVLPGAGLPLSATGVSGSQNGYNGSSTSFTWTAALVTSGTYPINTLGGTKACPAITITQSGTATPYSADFSRYLTSDPSNSANVIFTPPTTIPVPPTATPGSTISASSGYCVVVNAQATGGAVGSITVFVANPQAPLN